MNESKFKESSHVCPNCCKQANGFTVKEVLFDIPNDKIRIVFKCNECYTTAFINSTITNGNFMNSKQKMHKWEV